MKFIIWASKVSQTHSVLLIHIYKFIFQVNKQTAVVFSYLQYYTVFFLFQEKDLNLDRNKKLGPSDL